MRGSTASFREKVFVLCPSAVLLQYAAQGPEDRLPEKVLHLSRDSAAFVCDLVPGRHHVLHVAQSCGRGALPDPSPSLRAKWGLRASAHTRRVVASLVVVMRDARDLESWMLAIRREIDLLPARPRDMDVAARPRDMDVHSRARDSLTVKSSNDDNDSSSLTPSRPRSTRWSIFPASRLRLSGRHVSAPPVSAPPESTITPVPVRLDPVDESDTATIDHIELEASQLRDDHPAPDLPDDASEISSTMSDDVPPHPDGRRSEVTPTSRATSRTDVTPVSRATSRTGTVATTITRTSCSDSPTAPPRHPPIRATSVDATKDSSMCVPTTLAQRRKSALASSTPTDSRPPVPLNLARRTSRRDSDALPESPVAGIHGPIPRPFPPPTFHTTTPEKRDSKVPPSTDDSRTPSCERLPERPSTSQRPSTSERPQSSVGPLPPTASFPSCSRRSSFMPVTPAVAPPSSPDPLRPRPRRTSTFTMPLKINPSGPYARLVPTQPVDRRASQPVDPPISRPTYHPRSSRTSAFFPVSSPLPTRSLPPPPSATTPEATTTPDSEALQPNSTAHARPQPPPIRRLKPSRTPSITDSTWTLHWSTLSSTPSPAPAPAPVSASAPPFRLRLQPTPPRPASTPAPALSPNNDHRQLPNGHTHLPDNHTHLPDNHTHLPDKHTHLPDNHTHLPDNHTHLPDKHTHLPAFNPTHLPAFDPTHLPALDLGLPIAFLGPPAPPPSAPLPNLPVGADAAASRRGSRIEGTMAGATGPVGLGIY